MCCDHGRHSVCLSVCLLRPCISTLLCVFPRNFGECFEVPPSYAFCNNDQIGAWISLQSPIRATVMIYSHAKAQGQWSVGSEDSVDTNGQTDGGGCITSHANVVGNNKYPEIIICFTFNVRVHRLRSSIDCLMIDCSRSFSASHQHDRHGLTERPPVFCSQCPK